MCLATLNAAKPETLKQHSAAHTAAQGLLSPQSFPTQQAGTQTQKGPTMFIFFLKSILHLTSCLLLQTLTHLFFAVLPHWAHRSICSKKGE